LIVAITNFLFFDIIRIFQENVWDEYYHLKQRFFPDRPSESLILVEYDLNTLKALGPIENNISVWRMTIREIAEKAKVVAIDCGIGEEAAQGFPKIETKDIPKNIVFPLYAGGISTKDSVVEGKLWKPLCLEYFKNAGINYGHTVFYVDKDGVVRKVPSQVIIGKDSRLALSLEAVKLYSNREVKIVEAGGNSFLYVGNRRILLEYGGSFRPCFYLLDDFKRVSFLDVYLRRVPLSTFQNKLVLVGITLPGWGLRYLYPLEKQKLSPSITIQAAAISSLLEDKVFTIQPASYFYIFTVLLLLALSFIFAASSVSVSAVLAFLAVSLWFLISFYFYTQYLLIDSLFLPLATILDFAFVHAFLHAQEEKEKHLVENIFSRYLKPEIVKKIVENPDRAFESLKGTNRLASVLFADIRGFTSFCEKRKPEEVVRVLNLIFEKATEAIFSEDGMIDKFIGDAIMVLFNVPDDQPDHADRAIRAAIKIMNVLKEMDIGLNFGIGINTGEVVAGNIGSSKRMEYTAIGDAVNTASRICSVAGPGEILIGESTKAHLKGNYHLEEAGEWSLKGKEEKLKLYRVIYDYN
jgi:adenylate cyclase